MSFSRNRHPWLDSAIKALSKKLNTSLSLKNLGNTSGGSINSAGRLQTDRGDYFVKWNDSGPEDLFSTEAAGLKAMSGSHTRLIIPRPITWGSSGGTRFLIMDLLEFTRSNSNSQEELGRGLAELHQNTSARFGFDYNNYCGLTPQLNDWKDTWPDFYLENRLGFLWKMIEKERPLGSKSNQQFKMACANLQQELQSHESPCLIHGDLWSGNSENTTEGPAIFDPAAYYGHREAELGMMFLFGGYTDRSMDAYEEVFPLEPGWRSRLDIYKLYHLLNHHLLFGGGYGTQAMAIISKYV